MTDGVDDNSPAPSAGPLRIACYGYAQQDGGSGSSGSHVILREMVARGHLIDFFGKRSFAYPVGFENAPNFRFINVEGWAERQLGRGCARGPRLSRELFGLLCAGQTARNVTAAMRGEHQRQHYDVQLFLNLWAFGRVPGLPCVSVAQGPPGTDTRSVARHARLLVKTEGMARYLGLQAYAACRLLTSRPPIRNSDVILCGSQWSAGALRRYVPASVPIDPMPFPVDLDTFSPDPSIRQKEPAEILWLGRSVPRKRLDLFLAACERLIDAGRNVTVRGVGGFDYAPGYRRLVENFRHPDRIEWSTGVPRADVPTLLRRATVLVQTSEEENFGTSVAESLACGTPVVIGPTNGTLDFIGQGGRIFERYEPASVAEAIGAVLDAPAPDVLAGHARGAAEAAFDVRHIVDTLVGVLRRAASRRWTSAANRCLAQPVPT